MEVVRQESLGLAEDSALQGPSFCEERVGEGHLIGLCLVVFL